MQTMSGYRMLACRGFTLIELMVTIAILAIVLTVAVPGFQDFIARNRLAAATNELVSALALARSEAVKRATRVTVASADWAAGWQVFVDTGVAGDATDADDIVLRVYQSNANSGATITAHENFSTYISYLPSGVSEGSVGGGSGDFEICKAGQARVISISGTGRVSTASGPC